MRACICVYICVCVSPDSVIEQPLHSDTSAHAIDARIKMKVRRHFKVKPDFPWCGNIWFLLTMLALVVILELMFVWVGTKK